MEFTPSHYSYAQQEYDGWVSNLFSREGRAENKAKRAKRKRGKGRTKAAERLERRSGILTAKSKGTAGSLTAKSDFTDLWAEPFPWASRKRVVGASISGTAKGFRPSRRQVRQEFRATITGGLTALKLAGIAPYSSVDVESLPQKLKQLRSQDDKLVDAVSQASGKDFKGSLQRASRHIRKTVISKDLGRVAWPARASQMLKAGTRRAAGASVGIGVAAKGLHVAAGSSLAASPGPQAIITLPLAGILESAALVATALGAASSTKAAANKAQAAKYDQLVMQELEAWGGQQAVSQAAETLRESNRRAAYQEHVTRRVAQIRGYQATEAIKVLAAAGTISLLVVAGAAITMRARA